MRKTEIYTYFQKRPEYFNIIYEKIIEIFTNIFNLKEKSKFENVEIFIYSKKWRKYFGEPW